MLIVSEVLFVGVLSFGINQYVFRFMENWIWWQYVLMLVALVALMAGTILVCECIVSIKKKRRNKALNRTVGDFQLSVMQEFFKIRMLQAFGQDWTHQVKTVVEEKYANNDPYKQNYRGIYDVLRNEGVETLDEKDMDITNLAALMLYDFFEQCKVGSNFRQQIRNIQTDKNKLVSHITDSNDVLNVKILELTALKNIRSFLTYINNSTWLYSEKLEYVNRHQEQLASITQQLFQELVVDDQEMVEFESNKRNYLARIVSERAENANEYIPLSYKIDDGTSQRFDLNELYSNNLNGNGFVLFSKEAGYGKTWSVQELAGICAEEALVNSGEKKRMPILIRMGELAISEEPIMKAIQEILYPGDVSVEKARQYVGQESIVLFIDGMDEADKNNKEPAMRELTKLLSSAMDIKIIGGTRESDKQWYPAQLPRYSICDLTDKQVEAFIEKAYSAHILTEEQKKTAIFDYFENSKTRFLRNLRSPFYLKCFIDFVREGETTPDSDTDMINRCLNRMIEREINLKRFKATVQMVNEFLAELSKIIGNEQHYVEEKMALKVIKENLALTYDEESYASVVQIKDTLVELQILRELVSEQRSVLLGFEHEKYKSLFSPYAIDTSIWEY